MHPLYRWKMAGSGIGNPAVPPPPSPPAAATGGTFTLDVSTLSGGQYRTVPFDLDGEFRQVQFVWRQSAASQDMEAHYLEFHFTVAGVAEEL